MSEKLGGTMADFYGLPDGRKKFAEFMLAFEERKYGPDPKFTREESLELYGLQFDHALNALNNGKVSPDKLTKIEEEINDKKRAIIAAAHARQINK